jgi:hypothetical protein
MIPSQLHGCIDYGVSALFGAAASTASLSPPVRRTLGGAGAYHTGYGEEIRGHVRRMVWVYHPTSPL